MDGSDLMLLGLLLVVAPFAALLFLALGPLGWLALGGVVFLVGVAVTVREDAPDGDAGRAGTGWNCPDCGARNDADAGACHYCGTGRESESAAGHQ